MYRNVCAMHACMYYFIACVTGPRAATNMLCRGQHRSATLQSPALRKNASSPTYLVAGRVRSLTASQHLVGRHKPTHVASSAAATATAISAVKGRIDGGGMGA